jgi:hypothetical protein
MIISDPLVGAHAESGPRSRRIENGHGIVTSGERALRKSEMACST